MGETEMLAPRRSSSRLVEKRKEARRKTKQETMMSVPRRSSSRLAEKREEARRERELEIYQKRKRSEMLALRKIQLSYWREVCKSDSLGCFGMRVFKCKRNDCPIVVSLYAKMGLHRYNMVQGTNLQLHRIEKYNRNVRPMPSSYYITLVAKDPATRSLVTFQTSLHENRSFKMNVSCSLARLRKNTGTKGMLSDDKNAPEFLNISAPEWPSEDALADKNRFYMVQESEWEENDWIRLYLELAFVTTNRQIDNPKLSDLKMLMVVVETEGNVEPPNERLKGFRNAVVYIRYDQDLGKGRVCKRRAIVRRSVDLRTERMNLVGTNLEVTDSEQEASNE